ncbi:DUF3857 domain-containing protein [Sphingobacterium sp. LRF_L2]|uniref:DUF3857 domain-containing protein n=1 Tax=Sphingobacterium sp. LRF_L2 TaxID=3369421 RepID=UPI003F643370
MRLRIYFVSVLLVLLGQFSGYAALPKLTTASVPEWISVSKKQPVTPNLEDISDGYYFERIEYQVNLATQTRFHRDIKVLTENAGAENAGQVNISFEPQYQKLVLHELYVLRNGQKIDQLDIQKFELMAYESELSRSIYNGTYSAYLLLNDLRKDDKIVLSYSLQGFNPVFGGKFFDSYSLQGYEPFGLLHVNFVVPKSRQLQFKTFLNAPKASQQDLGSSISYYWDIAGTEQAPAYESYTPFWHSTRQRIECSEFKNWSDVAKWAAAVNPIPHLSKTGKLGQFTEQLWKDAKGDSLAYFKEVTDFVQNHIRYMGVEVGEYSHRANDPEKVFAQRYGDCKDKSVLLATMLKSRGIAANLVLANTMEEYKLEEYLPAPSAFNHMVVHATIDERGQYIDPTITNQGGAIRDRYFPFYGKVLWANTAGGLLRDTEKNVVGNMRIEESFKLQKDGKADLDVLTIYQGANADHIRSYFKETAKNQIEKSYLDYYKRFYKKLSKKSPLVYEDDISNNVFRVHEHYTIPEISEIDPSTNRRIVSVYTTNLSSQLPEITEERSTPISLDYPTSFEHDIYIINPDGVRIPSMKESKFVDRESYYFAKNIMTVDDTLKIAFRLGFHETYVKADKVQEYISDFIDKDSFFSAGLFIDDDGFATGSNTQHQINFWAVFAFIGLLGLFTWITLKFYHQRKASTIIPLYDEVQHNELGGWLIFLGLALITTSIRVFYNGMIELFFTQQTWNLLQYNVGYSPSLYHGLLLFEFIGNTFTIFLSSYCFYLMIKRRDIFPQTLLVLLVHQLLVVLLDTYFVWTIAKSNVLIETGSEIFRAVVFAIIWTLYIVKSTRVKGTFLVLSSSQAALYPPEPNLPPLPPVVGRDDQ